MFFRKALRFAFRVISLSPLCNGTLLCFLNTSFSFPEIMKNNVELKYSANSYTKEFVQVSDTVWELKLYCTTVSYEAVFHTNYMSRQKKNRQFYCWNWLYENIILRFEAFSGLTPLQYHNIEQLPYMKAVKQKCDFFLCSRCN